MKRKSPISVERIQFYTYESCEDLIVIFDITQFAYDDRRDFEADKTLAGLAVKIQVCNERFDRGARRRVDISLVDITDRCQIASRQICVKMSRDMFVRDVFVDFPIETTELRPGHAYRLKVCDVAAGVLLAETTFRLLDSDAMGPATRWYEIISGGIKPAWESLTYKVLNTVDCHDYYVRFTLTARMEPMFPVVLPELELRLYYPDGKRVTTQFREPAYFGLQDFKDGVLSVDYPFETCDEANGVFYAELLCMGWLVAGFVFDTESENLAGIWAAHEIEPLDEYTPEAAAMRLKELLPSGYESSPGFTDEDFDNMLQEFIDSQQTDTESEQTDDAPTEESPAREDPEPSLLASLDHLTGLRDVKAKLTVYERVVRFNIKRKDCGLPTLPTPLHAMFLGSPGTGKTTVAKLMGSMLRRAGVLSRGHVVVRERATLIGQYYSSEAEKTLAAIEEARGGILFIDEAYQLYQPDDPRDPGKFVIETLLTTLADEENRDWMLILAGYPERMKRMFEMNPGFKSRIPDSNIYTFDDFTEAELMEIAEKYLACNHYSLTEDARTALEHRLLADYGQREQNFGNARHVINLIQTEILPSMAVRVIEQGRMDNTALTEILAADIPAPISRVRTSLPRVGFRL